jgi:hypothetical protein
LKKHSKEGAKADPKCAGVPQAIENNDLHIDIDDGSTTCRTSMAKEEQAKI